MDPWRPVAPQSHYRPPHSSRVEQEVKDSTSVRKVQKADREKLRRERLNEQFLELGKALDPERPKNDKATVLTDVIQMLKDLTAQVNRLKSEYTSLSEESRELTQEKNELREEKAMLKSDIDNLNAQYQQRLRVMFPWSTMDHSVVMSAAPPPYPFPMPVPIPSGPIAIHPPMQPYHFFRGQNPGTNLNPYATYIPYSAPSNPQAEQPSNQEVTPNPNASRDRSHNPTERDTDSKPSGSHRRDSGERNGDFSDVATELELKTPGSATSSHSQVASDQELSSEGRKRKQGSPCKKSGGTEESVSSRGSSPCGLTESSSNSVGDCSIAKN